MTFEVQPLRVALSGTLASLLVTIGFSFLAARLMLLQAIPCLDQRSLNDWRRPYVGWSVLFIATLFAGQIVTSVLTVEKSWFGAGSFCVSTWAWAFNLLMYAGMALAVAYPATLIWCFSRRDLCPRKLDFSATDGSCGAGNYLLFLHTWSVSIIVFILVGSVIWLNLTMNAARLSQVYFTPIAVVTGSALWVGGRLVWNAICIRLLYRETLRGLGETWEDIQTQKPPGDPTINFLGEHWWKLPATVMAALTALWAIANWLLRS